MSLEYRVIWQREGQEKKRALYQTYKGAFTCAKRQRLARVEMEWVHTPIAEICFGPIIESRYVGPWSKTT